MAEAHSLPEVVLQIAAKNILNVKVVLQVATACENVYSPINRWKSVCFGPDTRLYFWPLNWKTPNSCIKTHTVK